MTLAHCSGGSNYSDRLVAEGEPVPKGGGTYRAGKPYIADARPYTVDANSSYRGEGLASYYGPDFHGRVTANGELYDMHAISAAHPAMPLPSYARVTSLDNGRSIIVRVNDRGPYVRNRIIDLSIGTAKALKFYGHGLARVRVEYIGAAPLEGSDDAMLLATLREGSPAPAPSKVMVAAKTPFLSDQETSKPASPASERAYTLAASARSPQEAPATQKSKSVSSARSQTFLQSASADPGLELYRISNPAPAAPNSTSLGVISGRGLY
jgi:rare lipoprotein A